MYAHQLYSDPEFAGGSRWWTGPNYDGILVSAVLVEDMEDEQKTVKRRLIEDAGGVHEFLRVPAEFPVMGDCGAFGYADRDKPPYSTDRVLDYYTALGFDYGVSVDHLVVMAKREEKRARYDLTVENASEFLAEHQARGLRWTPIGAVQGWDAASYADAARQYIAMGYKYIALGGLVMSTTQGILKVLEEVRRVVPAEVKIHLFGLARFAAMRDFVALGVSSVDSASMLRKAWLGSEKNYLSPRGWYSAVRIPPSDGVRAKKLLQLTARLATERADHAEARVCEEIPDIYISRDGLEKLEAECLKEIRRYARSDREVPTDGLVNLLASYDTLSGMPKLFEDDDKRGASLEITLGKLAKRLRQRKDLIRQTLTDRPWRECSCAVCNGCGVDVVIFRGNNRNRRRGFHNTYVFYRLIDRAIEGEHIEWLNGERTKERDPHVQPRLFN